MLETLRLSIDPKLWLDADIGTDAFARRQGSKSEGRRHYRAPAASSLFPKRRLILVGRSNLKTLKVYALTFGIVTKRKGRKD